MLLLCMYVATTHKNAAFVFYIDTHIATGFVASTYMLELVIRAHTSHAFYKLLVVILPLS